MLLFMLYFWGFVHAQTLLEASQGRVGRGISWEPNHDILVASSMDTCIDPQQSTKDWTRCGAVWEKWAIQQKENTDDRSYGIMWSVVSYLRGNDPSAAYRVFGYLLPEIEGVYSPKLYSYIILEGWLLQESGEDTSVLKLLEDFPVDHPDLIGVNIVHLDILHDMGKTRKRKKLIESVVAQGQTDAWFWWHLALEYRDGKEPETQEVQNLFVRSVQSANVSPFQYLDFVEWLEISGNVDGVLRYGLDGIRVFPHNDRLLQHMLHFAQTDEGLNLLENKVQAFPEHSKAQLLLGMAYWEKHQTSKAIEHLEQAALVGEKEFLRTDIYDILLEGWGSLGQLDRAWEHVRSQIDRNPNNMDLWKRWAVLSKSTTQKALYLDQMMLWWKHSSQDLSLKQIRDAYQLAMEIKDWEKAQFWIEIELAKQPSWNAWAKQAQLCQYMHLYVCTLEAYQQAFSLTTNNALLLNNWGLFMVDLHHDTSNTITVSLKEVLAVLQQLQETQTSIPAYYYDTLSIMYSEVGDREGAVQAIQKAVELEPDSTRYKQKMDLLSPK